MSTEYESLLMEVEGGEGGEGLYYEKTAATRQFISLIGGNYATSISPGN